MFPLFLALIFAPPATAQAPPAGKKIVLIAGPITGHPKFTHEYEKNVALLRHLIETSPDFQGVRVELHFGGWPADESTLDSADTIFLSSDGGDVATSPHPFNDDHRRAVIDKQVQRGCGLVFFHWSTFQPAKHHDQVTNWVGGYFDYETGPAPRNWFSTIETWNAHVRPATPPHPILRGVEPFQLKEEFYYRMKFRPMHDGVSPILAVDPPALKGAEKAGDQAGLWERTVGWAIERKTGGRGFGFTGGHFYENFWEPNFRKSVLNAIAWTARINVPASGIRSELISPAKLLIVTGHNHPAHDWRKVTASLITALEQDPRLIVTVTENPEDLAKISRRGEQSNTDPALSGIDLVVMNYCNWDRGGLSSEAKQNFVRFLENGGGLSVIHFANGAFTDTLPNKESDWEEYRTKIVRRIWVHGDGQSGHDAFGPFQVEITNVPHEITKGLEPFETVDELYFRQQGPLPIIPLAVAHSKVTGNDEPMAWAYEYGKGRVFQTVLGHGDLSVLKSAALIRRGTVWAANQSPLGFDLPLPQANALFRPGSPWTYEDSLKRGGLAAASNPPPKPASRDPLVDGKFGKAWNATTGGLFAAGKDEYRKPALTVEAWVKLSDKNSFNIIVAHENKDSGTHWEIFTEAGTGNLAAYFPGLNPDHVRSGIDICDDRWHYLAMTWEPARVRLYLDGKQTAEQLVESRENVTIESALAIGSLVSQELGCSGVIDEVRISRGRRKIEAIPSAPFENDEHTLGLWRFEKLEKNSVLDESKLKNAAGKDALFAINARESANVDQGRPRQFREKGQKDYGPGEKENWPDDRWQLTDTGPFFSATIDYPGGTVFKGIAVKVGAEGQAGILFDTEQLRYRVAWTDGFIKTFPARYGLIQKPAIAGRVIAATPNGTGWAHSGSFDDPRGKKPYGPLPREWGHYRGLRLHENRVMFEYNVNGTVVRESPWLESVNGNAVFSRSFEVDPAKTLLEVAVADESSHVQVVNKSGQSSPAKLLRKDGRQLVSIAPRAEKSHFVVLVSPAASAITNPASQEFAKQELAGFTQLQAAGNGRWGEPLVTQGKLGADTAGFAVDTVTMPFNNPFRSLLFAGGHDFLPDGRAIVCMVHGDVWLVDGLDESLKHVTWRRFATGLFQPLGVKIVRGEIYVLGRDQITRLRDENGDGEADWYENFNNDGQVTDNAHEYVTSLETDAKGNFYYSKADSEMRTDHDGCILRVSADGSKLDVFATGFRNTNGMGVGPGDIVTVAPQQGTWTPSSGIWQAHFGGFHGAMQSHHMPDKPRTFIPPLVWIPHFKDNSSGGQVWVPNGHWGPLSGQMLHLSFGQCRVLLTLVEPPGSGQSSLSPAGVPEFAQGGVITLPIEFESGVMRGRFHPLDGNLYVTGMRGWQTRATQDGCFQRVRRTESPLDIPVSVKTMENGVALTFSRELDTESAEDIGNYFLEMWNYRWSQNYGSPELRVSDPAREGRDAVDVKSATLLPDRKTVFLEIDPLVTCDQLAINYVIQAADDKEIRQSIYYTVRWIGRGRMDATQLHRNRGHNQLTEELKARLKPGLIARFADEDSFEGSPPKFQDASVTRMAALRVEHGSTATPFLNPGPFSASYEGWISVSLPGTYRFRILGSGTAALSINDKPVTSKQKLDPASPMPPSAPVRLRGGFNQVKLIYTPGDSNPMFRLMWSGADFLEEPVPAEVLWHDSEDEALLRQSELRHGRQLFAEHNCVMCHVDPALTMAGQRSKLGGVVGSSRALAAARSGLRFMMPELLLELPRFDRIGERINADWIAVWLQNPSGLRNEVHMPRMLPDGAAGAQEAADLAAYLISSSLHGGEDPDEVIAGEDQIAGARKTGDSARGEILYEDLNCIACHRFTLPAQVDEHSRVSLAFAKVKYRAGEMASLLLAPQKYHRSSRMPTFKLSDQEAADLEVYVRAKSTADLPKGDPAQPGDPSRGSRLFVERGCRQCHFVREIEATPRLPIKAGNQGCLAEVVAGAGRIPVWNFSDDERKAIQQFLKKGVASLESDVVVEAAQRTMTRFRCGACHDRDGIRGLRANILIEEGTRGLNPEVFPTLSWTGEKLNGVWLEKFLRGQFPESPRPWLKGRMPTFPRLANVISTGLAHQHGMSVTAEADDGTGRNHESPDVGAKLVASKGLDCRQCHAAGKEPATGDKNTLTSPGINFALVPHRLRYEYYHRFVLDPPRYDMNAKMPKLSENGRTKVVDLMDGDAARQFDAVWEYLKQVR